jgi:hypothetical protein
MGDDSADARCNSLMKSTFLCLLCAVFGLPAPDDAWRRRERLQNEDLASIRHWVGQKYGSLSRYYVADKRPIDGTWSVMAVMAYGKDEAAFSAFGLCAVYGRTNQVYMVLDLGTDAPHSCMPVLEPPAKDVVYVHRYADYALYRATHKYVYDLDQRRPAVRHAYERFSVESALAGRRK